MKKDIGFRFDEDFHEILLALSKRMSRTRTEVVEHAVRKLNEIQLRADAIDMPDRAGTLEKSVDRPTAEQLLETARNKRPKKVVASMTVPGDKSEGRKNPPPPRNAPPSGLPLTREEREAKIAAFQRKMAKGKK